MKKPYIKVELAGSFYLEDLTRTLIGKAAWFVVVEVNAHTWVVTTHNTPGLKRALINCGELSLVDVIQAPIDARVAMKE